MKTCGEIIFLTLALLGSELSTSFLDRFRPGEKATVPIGWENEWGLELWRKLSYA
jgi:hypothetical protein